VRSTLKKAQEDSKRFADKKRREVKYKVGDMVFLDRRFIKTKRPCLKLDWKKLGPFKISEVINEVSYKLDLPQTMGRLHNVFHVSLLFPANQTLNRPNQDKPPPVILDREHEYFEVEDILDSRKRGNKWQFLVSWKGYPADQNSWEPEENIMNCQHLIRDHKSRYCQP
jgi:hypothetical protein